MGTEYRQASVKLMQDSLGDYWDSRISSMIPYNWQYQGCSAQQFAPAPSDVIGQWDPSARPLPASVPFSCDIGLGPAQSSWVREAQKQAVGDRNPLTTRYAAEDRAFESRMPGQDAYFQGANTRQSGVSGLWSLNDVSASAFGTVYQGIK